MTPAAHRIPVSAPFAAPIWHPPEESVTAVDPLDAAPPAPLSDGMHTITQPPSLARTGPSQFVSHPQVHVEGQSESTLHCPGGWATQL